MTAPEKQTKTAGIRRGDQWIVFRLGETEYIIHSAQILQIEMPENITVVPNTQPFVRGIAYLRGQVVPVIDLRVRLGLPPAEMDLASRIVVVGSQERPVGLLVDSAREVIYLEQADVEPAPEVATSGSATHVSGVAVMENRVLLALDVDKVLQTQLRLAPVGEIDPATRSSSPRGTRGARGEGEEQRGEDNAVL